MSKPVGLAVAFKHHLFDILYHAVALQVPDSMFFPADAQYFRNAAKLGRIIELKDCSA